MIAYFKENKMLPALDEEALKQSLRIAGEIFV
jgi:hypothetical protein